jgi:hypothetical protein
VQLKINNLTVLISLILIGLLIFALIRGCNNSRDNAALAVNYKQRESDLKDILKKVNEENAAYKDTVEFLNGQLSLTDNKLLSLNEDLRGANDRITTLLKKHVPITPSLDTNVTTVPNLFLDECADCFKELGNGQRLVIKYKAEKEGQEKTYKNLLSVKDNRINSLEKSNDSLMRSYTSLLDSSKKFQENFMPRGRLYLSWGVLWSPWPVAAGAGVLYQNKRNMIYGAKIYYGVNKTQVETTMNFPLSFKKR